MLLPIGDQPNPREYTPWITYSLIFANVAIYLALTLPISFASRWLEHRTRYEH